jgi:hypothetical protein
MRDEVVYTTSRLQRSRLDLEPHCLTSIKLASPAIRQPVDEVQAEMACTYYAGRVAELRSTIGDDNSNDRIIDLQPEADLAVLLGLPMTDGVAHDLRDHNDELSSPLGRQPATHEISSVQAHKSGRRARMRKSMFHSR